MKRILMLVSLVPFCVHAMQQQVQRQIFNGNDYLAGKETLFNPNAYINYRSSNISFNGQVEPIKGAGILPVVRDENGELHAILAQAIVENGVSEQNGKTLVYITPSQDRAFDYESAVSMASRAEELQILDSDIFQPFAVVPAICKARAALPGNGLICGGYGTMSYVAEFEGLGVKTVEDLCKKVQPQLDVIAAIKDAQEEKEAYNKLFPTTAVKERSYRIKRFEVVPFNALLGAIEKAQDTATDQKNMDSSSC
jgi:hypothetical protein